MTRKAFVIALMTVAMSAHMTACSSSGSKDDSSVAQSNDETFAEEGEGDFADTASKDKSTGSSDQAAKDAPPADSGADLSIEGGDQAVANKEASPPDAATAEAPPADGAPPAEVAKNDKPADELSLDDPGALPEDAAAPAATAENITDNPAAPSDAGVFEAPKKEEAVADNTPPPDVAPESSAPVVDPAPTTSTPRASGPVVYAPLLKVKGAPFTAPGGATMNRVYIARPKDTNKSIAQKIYNDSKRSKDLVKWNPVLKRGARAGDKVYYSSAANPSDSRMMNFYEEAGVPAQTYVTKDGDNLRTISKSLLGFKDAWKEIWVTNASVDSKGKVPAGLSLTYWPESGTAAPVQAMAQNSTPPTDSSGLPTSLPDAAPQVPQPPPNSAAMGKVAPPPADPFNAPPPAQAASQAPPSGPDPLAPPPPSDAMNATPPAQAANDPMAPPPAAPTVAAKPPKKPVAAAAPAEESGMDPDTTLALGVGGILILAAAILFVVIRKNRAKRMDLGQTQV